MGRDESPGSLFHEGEDCGASRAEILRLDWRQHPGQSVDVHQHVDIKIRIRRVWTVNSPPKMQLNITGKKKKCRHGSPIRFREPYVLRTVSTLCTINNVLFWVF